MPIFYTTTALLIAPCFAQAAPDAPPAEAAVVESVDHVRPTDPAEAAMQAEAQLVRAERIAHHDALMGTSCAASTAVMVRRVLEHGQDWSEVTAIQDAEGIIDVPVAAPYVTRSPLQGRLVANGVLENLAAAGVSASLLHLVGRELQVDGVPYVVLTSYSVVGD